MDVIMTIATMTTAMMAMVMNYGGNILAMAMTICGDILQKNIPSPNILDRIKKKKLDCYTRGQNIPTW